MKINPKGRDWSLHVNWDDLAKLYAALIIAWTFILAAGSIWLIVNRHLTSVRIRNVGVTIAAVSFLHIYLVKIFLAYTTNGHFTCHSEFWIMSIYLPFGIALFQASSVQLESISEEQQSLLHREAYFSPQGKDRRKRSGSLKERWLFATAAEKTYVWIGLGMLSQLIITAIIYGTTPTLQGDWSSYGNVTFAKGQKLCRGSKAWIPSAFWQLFWSWIYGPYTLYRIRNVNDVHYWRLQVILTVLAGLPGVPLWLAALYTPPGPWNTVNPWFVPPMWLAPGIMVMQAVTIFFPIYEAYIDRFQLRRTLSILKKWEESRKSDDIQSMSNSSSLSTYDKRSSQSVPDPTRRRSEMYTMAALEKALALNPQPLLHFAATKDFTAENIIFLLQVRRWHSEWDRAVMHNNTLALNKSSRARLYDMAIEIYATSVSETTAEFPINVEGRIRCSLNKVFAEALAARDAHPEQARRADSFDLPILNMSDVASMTNTVKRESSMESTSKLFDRPSSSSLASSAHGRFSFDPHPCVRPLGVEVLSAGPGVTKHVFDEAEQSIKYLVLTNTWQKLVKAHYNVDLS